MITKERKTNSIDGDISLQNVIPVRFTRYFVFPHKGLKQGKKALLVDSFSHSSVAHHSLLA